MSRIFISYSSTERTEALGIQNWLEHNGWEDDVFVDVDPEHGLTGGKGWRSALRDAAGRCEAVILLLSRAWLNSKPCWNEFLLAEKYGKPCIPVRIDEGLAIADIPPEITNNYQVIEKISVPLPEFEIRLKRALEAAGAGPENFPLPANSRPYPGLKALTENDAALLFGRDADVLAALDTLREIHSTGRRRLFAILGASGAGKSSLMRAGIWPRLNRDDRNFIALPIVRPANAILSGKQGLWQALETACTDQRRSQHLPDNIPKTRAAIRLAVEQNADAFADLLAALKQAAMQSFFDKNATPPTLMLFIDQGEELFNSEGATEASTFFKLLNPIWEQDVSFTLVIAIRSDVYPQLQTDPRIPNQQIRPFNLSPMPPAGLHQVIEGPAERIGFAVDPTLTAALLRDSEGADTLPLLAFTLERLYDERLDDKNLTLDDYNRLGGVKGAIEAAAGKARAEAQANGLPTNELDKLLRRTFLPHLARVNEAGEFARRVAELSEIDNDCLPLVNVLVSQRLLIADQRGDSKTIEIAHEAILREWPLLAGWLDAERGFLEWREQIGRARKLYERDKGDLLTGRSLVIAQGFMETRPENIGEDDRVFIQASLDEEAQRIAEEKAEQEARQQTELKAAKAREEAAVAAAEAEKKVADAAQKSSRKMRGLAVVLAVLTIGAAGAGYLAFFNQQKAETETRRAEAETKRAEGEAKRAKESNEQAIWASMESESRRIALVTESVRERSGDDKALALAWLASPKDRKMKSRPLTSEASSSIYQRRTKYIRTIEDNYLSIFSPDDKKIFSINSEGGAELWSLGLVDFQLNFKNVKYGEKYYYNKPYFFKKGELILVHYNNDINKLINLNDRSIDYEIPYLEASEKVVWGGEGTYNGNDDISIKPVSSNEIFVISENKKSASLINIDNKKEKTIKFRRTHFDAIGNVYVNPRGNRLIAHHDGLYRSEKTELWNLETGKKILEFPFDGYHVSVDFNKDNEALFSMYNGESSVWNLKSGILMAKYENLTYTNDMFYFLFGSKIIGIIDGNLSLFDRETKEIEVLSKGMLRLWLDKEKNVIVAIGTYKIEVWHVDYESQVVLRKSIIHEENDIYSENYAVSSDGSYLMTPSKDFRKIKIWNLVNGSVHSTIHLNGRFDESSSDENFTFSFNGDFVAIPEINDESNEKTLSVWNIDFHKENIISRMALIKGMAFFKKGVLLAKNGNLFFLSDTGFGEKIIFEKHKNKIINLVVDNYSKHILTGSWDKVGQLWSATTGKLIHTLKGHKSAVTAVAFSPNDQQALTASHDATAKLWNAATGEHIHTFKGHTASITQASFTPDGTKVLTASSDTTLKIWDTATGELIYTLSSHTGPIFTASFSPDGSKILSASEDHTAKIWDTNTGELLATLDIHKGFVNDAQWSQQGNYIVTTSQDKRGILWDAKTFKLHKTLKGHLGAVKKGKFTPDEKQVVTISDDQTMRLWDVETGALLATHEGHEKTIHDMDISPDGRQVATASADGTARVWKIFPGSLRERIAEVGEIVKELQPLTHDECEQYDVLDLPGADIACQPQVADTFQ